MISEPSLKFWLLSIGKLSSSCLAVQSSSPLHALEWHLLPAAFLPVATLSGQYRVHALVLKLLRKEKQHLAAGVCHLVVIMATFAKTIATRISSSTWNATAMARSPVLEQTTLAPSTSPLDHGKKAICSLRRDIYSTPEIQAALSITLRTGGILSSIPATAMARISQRAFKECGTSAKKVGEAIMTVVISTSGSNRKWSALAFEVHDLVEPPKRRLLWIISVAESFREASQGQACMHVILMNLKMYSVWLGQLISLRTAICELLINWAPHPLVLLHWHSRIAAEGQSILGWLASFLALHGKCFLCCSTCCCLV